MPKVYIPQVPSRFDAATRLWVPSVNLQPAERYGEICIALPPNANRLHTAPLTQALKEAMKDITAEDYIVAVGDPSLIAAASVIAWRKTGKLRILKWDRMSSAYLNVELEL